MRLVATVFLWLVTTALLAVAVPTMWAERNVVERGRLRRVGRRRGERIRHCRGDG